MFPPTSLRKTIHINENPVVRRNAWLLVVGLFRPLIAQPLLHGLDQRRGALARGIPDRGGGSLGLDGISRSMLSCPVDDNEQISCPRGDLERVGRGMVRSEKELQPRMALLEDLRRPGKCGYFQRIQRDLSPYSDKVG